MTEKIQRKSTNHLGKEELGDKLFSVDTQLQDDNTIGEVGILDAPNGGRAAWTVVFGSFCVSNLYTKNIVFTNSISNF